MITIDNNEKRIVLGIWIQVYAKNAFRGEGIARLLAFVLRSAQKRQDVKVLIACPGWIEGDVREYLNELKIDVDKKIEFLISGKKEPLLFRLYNFLENRKKVSVKKKYDFRRVKELFGNFGGFFLNKVLGLRSWPALILLLLFALPIALFLALLVVPLITFSLILKSSIAKRILKKLSLKKFYLGIKNKYLSILHKMYYRMIDNEFEVLAKKSSKRRDISCWYVPHPAWSHVLNVKKPIIVAVPDLVYLDFPVKFSAMPFIDKIDKKATSLIEQAVATISYSQYVRDNHVVKRFGFNKERAFVIPHAPVETYEYLEKLHKRLKKDLPTVSTLVIKKYLEKKKDTKSNIEKYIKRLPFEDIEYIFVSSQVRPHKNYLNLFKAYEILLRRKYRNIKLIITGTMDKELSDFIKERRLHLDILSIPNLPPKVHAAFYARAALTVVPTLFEGGFPFCFSESLSVNVPVVMSSIPVTEEVIDDELASDMLFDPYDVNSIVSRIEWALDNRDELLAKQLTRYNDMKKRTWDDVGDEYINVFEKVVREHKDF